jgi:methylenetetrahydrofolate reductase (NADPH)
MQQRVNAAAKSVRVTRLIDGDISIEISPEEVQTFAPDQNIIPRGSRVFVPHIKGKPLSLQVEAAKTLKQMGYVPVPHFGARNYDSDKEYIDHLQAHARNGIQHALFVGGNPLVSAGALLRAEQLLGHPALGDTPIRVAFIAAYPEGHPGISDGALRRAFEQKRLLCRERGLAVRAISQFAFDGRAIGSWVKSVHSEFPDLSVHVGIAGVTSLPKLIKFAAKCGVGASLALLRQPAGKLLSVLTDHDPAGVVRGIEESYPVPVGPLSLHFFPFGGWKKTLDWVRLTRNYRCWSEPAIGPNSSATSGYAKGGSFG